MTFTKFYYLIFYKIYKFSSWTRSKEEASLVASFLIGFLIVLWSIYILAILKIKKSIPPYFFWTAFIIMILANILYFFRNHKYEKVIDIIESSKVPILYRVIVYLLMSWSFVGIVFL